MMKNKLFDAITTTIVSIKTFRYESFTEINGGAGKCDTNKNEAPLLDKKDTRSKKTRWLKLLLFTIGLVLLSFGLAYILQKVLIHYEDSLLRFAWLAYLGVFGVMLLGNLTIFAPVPVATVIMITIATKWDPLLVALFSSIGGTLGELSGYYAGYFGKKKILNGSRPGHSKIDNWLKRYGVWAIFLLALQPIIPFDLAGLAAGVSKMPVFKFLTALFPAKFIRYVVFCYFGAGLIKLLPWIFGL